jgi:hypothetical protein
MALSLAFSLAGLQTGCAVWQTLPFKSYPTPPVPEALVRYYDYPKGALEATVVKEERRKRFLYRQVEIPLNLPKEVQFKPVEELKKEVAEMRKANNEKGARDLSLHYTNRLDLYYTTKRKGERPLILISPITGGNMVVDRFAKYFASHGYVAVIVNRKKPFYDQSRGPEQVEQYLRSSIIRLRQALDWLEQQPEIDPEKIGGFGVSYGAVLHTILAAIEPRVKYHVLAMPAAPLADVILYCPDAGIKKPVTGLEKSGWTRAKIHSELKRTIKTDPLTFAPYVPKDRVVVYWALFDRVVGSSRTFRLWKAMKKPPLRVIPLGHYGGVLIFPYLQFASLRFFDKRF